MVFGFKSRRLISIFLIIFGIMGYVACIPITYFANLTLHILPPSLDEVQNNLEGIKEIADEAETVLSSVNVSIEGIILSVSLLDIQSTIDSINSTFYSINGMLNETVYALDTVEQNVNNTADWLDSFAGNSWILFGAPELAAEASDLAASMRFTSEILNNLLFRPTIESLYDLQSYVNVMLSQLKSVNDYVVNQLRTFKTYIENVMNRIENMKASIDTWIDNIRKVYDTLWIIRVGIYGLIGYILMLHTAFLLIGFTLRQ